MNRSFRLLLMALAVFATLARISYSQPHNSVRTPQISQAARVEQTIGLTEMEITYHRPAVKGRAIWGGLVPFNNGKPFPWRGGANENTTISFSTDVSIEGKPLPAGTYGLHFIPSADSWIVIFSKNHTAWGSFSYKESEDALRVTVKPHEAPFEEYLTYSFVDPKPSSVIAELHWEKLAVDINITIDRVKTVMGNLRETLGASAKPTWQDYNNAASFCEKESVELQQGLEWIDRSIAIESHFDNQQTKSQILRRMGKTAEADAVIKAAMATASPMEINSYARVLAGEGNPQEAMEIFRENAKNHPDQWIVYAGLARGYEALGDLPNAIAQMKIALSKAPDDAKNNITGTIQQWEGMSQKK